MSEKEQIEHISDVLGRFNSNLDRINNLVEISAKLFPDDLKRLIEIDNLGEWLDDILRAAVVFSHASLEDGLREIARLKLSESSEKVLNGISLAGTHPDKKFSLGILNKHRGKSVDELVQESINEFLDRESYNNTTDIANMLNKIGIDPSRVDRYFATLDQMISRRHQIVHRADLEGSPKSWRLVSIEAGDVMTWVGCTREFVFEVALLALPASLHEPVRKVMEQAKK